MVDFLLPEGLEQRFDETGITVKVVSQEAYEEWLDGAIEEYAGTPRQVQVAAAD